MGVVVLALAAFAAAEDGGGGAFLADAQAVAFAVFYAGGHLVDNYF